MLCQKDLVILKDTVHKIYTQSTVKENIQPLAANYMIQRFTNDIPQLYNYQMPF